ncbi:hypothetical protein [Treponema sp.]|uniref:hypothetical protein n=1 Tax=Treponema sp. TaxID=166 RepID=UPI0025F35C39|nr:hypothetical protein [Treponema sp.]MCR5217848.1 hypothetical protein [Treponema sp.]
MADAGISLSQSDLDKLFMAHAEEKKTSGLVTDFCSKIRNNIKKNTARAGKTSLADITNCRVTQEEVDSLFKKSM